MFSLVLLFVPVCVLLFFWGGGGWALLALWSPRLEKRELVYVRLVHLYVYFERVDFCPFLFLMVRGWLRFVIMALTVHVY